METYNKKTRKKKKDVWKTDAGFGFENCWKGRCMLGCVPEQLAASHYDDLSVTGGPRQ